MSMTPVTLVAKTASKLARSISVNSPKHANSGIVDQDVQFAELLLDLLKRPQDVGLIGDVRLYTQDAQRASGFRQLLGVAPW